MYSKLICGKVKSAYRKSREFDVEESVFSADKKLLRFYGIDTLSEQLTLEEFEKQLSVVSYHEVLYKRNSEKKTAESKNSEKKKAESKKVKNKGACIISAGSFL